MRCGIICCGRAPFGSDLDWTDVDFLKSFNELKNVVGNCLNRTVKMIDRYRAGVLPAAGELEKIDRDLLGHGEQLPSQLAAAYAGIDLQQCAELPVQLAGSPTATSTLRNRSGWPKTHRRRRGSTRC